MREACTPPVYPTMEKTPGTVTENDEDGTQRVEYLVKVTSPAPVAGQPVTNVIYALKETPDALPSGVTLHRRLARREGRRRARRPPRTTWNGTGDWNLQTHRRRSRPRTARQASSFTPTVCGPTSRSTSIPTTMPEACGDDGADGIPVWNTVTLAIGEQSISDDACVRVNFDDVKLDEDRGPSRRSRPRCSRATSSTTC